MLTPSKNSIAKDSVNNPIPRSYRGSYDSLHCQQQATKYQTLAQEALANGDPIMAEYYFQHQEHFKRVKGMHLQVEDNPLAS
jgi:Domain of unknown function (DUF4167)